MKTVIVNQEAIYKMYSGFYETYILDNGVYTRKLLSVIDRSVAGTTFTDVLWLYNIGITQGIQNMDNREAHPSNIGFNPTLNMWCAWNVSGSYQGQTVNGFPIGTVITMDSSVLWHLVS